MAKPEQPGLPPKIDTAKLLQMVAEGDGLATMSQTFRVSIKVVRTHLSRHGYQADGRGGFVQRSQPTTNRQPSGLPKVITHTHDGAAISLPAVAMLKGNPKYQAQKAGA